jgi:RNA polymerase sigma factor (sigma-70 family)
VEVLRGGRVKVGGDAVKFRRYLATLVRNELVSRWRRRRARGGGASVSLDDPSAGIEAAVDSETAATIDAKWRLARHSAAEEWTLGKTALSAQSKAVYRAYVLEERPIAEVAAEFGISRNSVSQIKTRVERMIAAIESEF